jgi:hypothetical protein
MFNWQFVMGDLRWAIFNGQDAIGNMQFVVGNLRWVFFNGQCAIGNMGNF